MSHSEKQAVAVRKRGSMTMSQYLTKEDLYKARWEEAEKELELVKGNLEALKDRLLRSNRGRQFLAENHQVDLEALRKQESLAEEIQGRLALFYANAKGGEVLRGTPEGHLLTLIKQYFVCNQEAGHGS